MAPSDIQLLKNKYWNTTTTNQGFTTATETTATFVNTLRNQFLEQQSLEAKPLFMRVDEELFKDIDLSVKVNFENSENQKKTVEQNEKINNALEPYFKGLVNFYLAAHPEVRGELSYKDLHHLSYREQFEIIKQIKELALKTNYSFSKQLLEFYQSIYPEQVRKAKEICEGEGIEWLIRVIKEIIKEKL